MAKMDEDNKAWFLELYNECRTDKEIAKIIGVSASTISHFRNRLGLEPYYKRMTRELYEKVKSLYNEGLCDGDISKITLRTPEYIRLIRCRTLHSPPNISKYISGKALVEWYEFCSTTKQIEEELKVAEVQDNIITYPRLKNKKNIDDD